MSLSKNITNNLPEKSSGFNQGQLTLQTPNKVNRTSNLNYSQNRSHYSSTNLFSSGKLNKNISTNFNNLSCSYYLCNSTECYCNQFDMAMKSFICSPSTNFILQSPDSFEKHMNSQATERINVLNIKNKIEARAVIKIDQLKEEIQENKENSSILSNSNTITPLGNKNLNSDGKKSWKSSKSKNFSKRKSIFSKEHSNTKKNLLNEFEQNDENFLQISRLKDKEFDDEVEFKKDLNFTDENDLNRKTPRRRHYSIQEILDSPDCSEKKYFTTEKKRKIFECSDYKEKNFTNSLTSSDYKSIVFDPTVFSTQKKEKKRHRKNSFQMSILQDEYKLTKCKDWSKEKISEISLKTGLPENKVYKWLWDQKNKDMFENKRFFIRSGN